MLCFLENQLNPYPPPKKKLSDLRELHKIT